LNGTQGVQGIQGSYPTDYSALTLVFGGL